MSESFDIVIFGGSGDLALRKLLPALYRSELDDHLHDEARIFITMRERAHVDTIMDEVRKWLRSQIKESENPELKWDKFAARIIPLSIDSAADDDRWPAMAAALNEFPDRDRIFYYSLPPSIYGETSEMLARHNMITKHSRVVLEKPIGYSQATAEQLNTEVAQYFREETIFRIDHYLGKETVQNLLALRFANSLFESSNWSNEGIDYVQISLAEEVGLEGRVAFYDQAGAMRDMIQSHLLQLLCLVAMDPPHQLNAECIRTEKLKVLQALRPITAQTIHKDTVRGQYAAGAMGNQPVPSYLEELGDASNTETYVAIKAHIDNWRWQGVPFYLRTGKRLKQRCAEITIHFKPVSHNAFGPDIGEVKANRLVIRLQPNEGMQLRLTSKQLHKYEMKLQSVPLNLDFAEAFENLRSDSYQRLLMNVIDNDLSLFAHRDEIDLAWAWVDPILDAWKDNLTPLYPYQAGSWGPEEAYQLTAESGHNWINAGMK